MELVRREEIPDPPYLTPEVSLSKLCAAFQGMEDICISMGGMGVSAPQVGLPWNMFVYWANFPDKPFEFCRMLDCSYEPLSAERFPSVEGCLSLGNCKFILDRYDSVRVSGRMFVERQGKMALEEFAKDFSGIFSAVLQHEIDHCHGVSVDSSGRRVAIS